jgi:hypothetical protein
MFVRRGPAIVLSFVLGAAALVSAPALASDGGAAKDNVEVQWESCEGPGGAMTRLKAWPIEGNSYRFRVVGAVFSDDNDVWEWKLRFNGTVTDEGRARGREDSDLAFRVSRMMIDFSGPDTVSFRAENLRTGAVCKATVYY